MDRSTERELLDRTRRIETRLTAFMIQQGYDPGSQTPLWEPVSGSLTIPSSKVSLQDMIDEIPPGVSSAPIWLRGQYFCTLTNFRK